MRKSARIAGTLGLCLVAVSVGCAGPSEALAQPSGPPPAAAPPSPPPDAVPPPPDAAGVPPGQWVFTQQYGWVWMTYDDAYTYVPPQGYGEPLEYLYYPSYGWAWVAAPWIWGVGPWPYFGTRGPGAFAWYGHGYWRQPRRWRYRPAPAPGRGIAVRDHERGIRPAPARASRRPVPREEERRPAARGERGDGGRREEGERR